MSKQSRLTRDEVQQFKNGAISGLTSAIDEIMNVIANTESDEAVYALDIVRVRLNAQRLKHTAELKLMLEDSA